MRPSNLPFNCYLLPLHEFVVCWKPNPNVLSSCQVAMAHWTSLFVIESTCVSSKQALFSPSLVYVVNWVAQNPFLAKFMYAACRVCHKSMKHGHHYHHDYRAELIYRFHIVLDVVHDGIPLSRPRFGIVGSVCWNSLYQSGKSWKRRSTIETTYDFFQKVPKL